MHRTLVLFSLIFSIGGLLLADPIQLSGPVEGFTFDIPTGSFRAVLGFPGSASFGEASLASFEFGSVAPQKDYGLALQNGQYSVVTGLGSASPSAAALSGLAANPEGVVWSGDGALAVFFSRSGNWIQTVAGLPGNGIPGTPVDLSILSGSLSAIAADSSGKLIAVGVAGESGGVYLMADGGAPVSLLACSKPIALAFSDDGRELYSVDGATLQVTTFQLANLTSQSFTLDGLLDPIAIKLKRDAENRLLLLIAGRNDHLFRVYDLGSHQIVTDIPLDFPPSELVDFGRDSFLLNSPTNSGEPLWIFSTVPRQDVYFVPAAPATSGGPQ